MREKWSKMMSKLRHPLDEVAAIWAPMPLVLLAPAPAEDRGLDRVRERMDEWVVE